MENSWNNSDQQTMEFPWETHGNSYGQKAMENSWNN